MNPRKNLEPAVEHILRRRDVERLTGLSRSSIYAKMATHEFPQSIQLSERASGWLESEIIAWQQARIAKRDRPALPVKKSRQTDSNDVQNTSHSNGTATRAAR